MAGRICVNLALPELPGEEEPKVSIKGGDRSQIIGPLVWFHLFGPKRLVRNYTPVIEELKWGKILIGIEYSPNPWKYISAEHYPQQLLRRVKIENRDKEPKAIVDITADQKARAIGKSGINIRLASMLTKFQIELNEVEGIT